MKVTITAPFARVQVEMSAGAAADLMMEAVGLARRCEEYREADLAGSAGAGVERDFGRLMSAVAAEENRGGEAEALRADAYQSAGGDRKSGNPSVTADAVPAPFAQGSLAAAAAGLKDGTQEYWGFLYTRCEKCMEVRGYFTKQHMTEYKCRCGHRTPLTGLRKLAVKCYCCGTEIKYRTNLAEERFTVACHNCGAPVEVELHSKLKEYVTF